MIGQRQVPHVKTCFISYSIAALMANRSTCAAWHVFIWNCQQPSDAARNEDFMNAFLMQPADSEEDVYQQLCKIHERLKPLVIAEMHVYAQAVLSLKYPTVKEYPELYRSAVSNSAGYNSDDFAPALFEYPGNWGPQEYPLSQNFEEALFGALSPGSIITAKSPWNFTQRLKRD